MHALIDVLRGLETCWLIGAIAVSALMVQA